VLCSKGGHVVITKPSDSDHTRSVVNVVGCTGDSEWSNISCQVVSYNTEPDVWAAAGFCLLN
jgi:hypothetical protein